MNWLSPYQSIVCAECDATCGKQYPDTHDQPGDGRLFNGTFVDEKTGRVYCSDECYRKTHPHVCPACRDTKVAESWEVCDGCRISAVDDWIGDGWSRCQLLIAAADAIAQKQALAELCEAYQVQSAGRAVRA